MEDGPISDIHDLNSITGPATLTFFDAAAEKVMNFVCPMLGIVGFTLASLRLDMMHVFDLGVLQWTIGAVLWRLIGNNAF
eukprot:6181612-Alexandrium_andersonii.AAC.1